MANKVWIHNSVWMCSGIEVNGYMTNAEILHDGIVITRNWSGTEKDFDDYCKSH